MTATRPLDQEWFTARELAALQLRDLPSSESAMLRYAAREGWNDDPARCRDRAGRGGGLEYHLSLIPTLAWADYHRRTMVVGEVEPIRPQPVLPTPETERARVTQAARLAILTALERYGAGLNLREEGRVFAFAGAYNMGHLAVDAWVREAVPTVSKRSLFRWRAEAKAGQSLGFDRSLARKGKGILETANGGHVKTFVLALIAHQPGLKAERVQAMIVSEFGTELMAPDGSLKPVPPVRTIQHQLSIWRQSEVVVLAKLSDPDRYRSTMAPAGVGMMRHVQTPNQLWMIDASPLDALDTTASRPTVYACIDIATRRLVLYVSRTPRASAVALLLRKAMLAWGVPTAIKTDNGSDFVASDTKRLIDALGIELILSDAYSPAQKGHVERVIETMQHGFAELLPGYVGHNVTERKRLEDRKGFAARLGAETAELFGTRYSMDEIQALADRWVEIVYMHTVHSALGKTPAEAARAAGATTRTVDVRALDVLLMPVADGGYRQVTKMGVRVGGYHYATIKALPGERVLVRMDPSDFGRVLLFAESGAYIEPAVCPELAGIDGADYMATVKKERAALLKERTDPIRREVRDLTSGAPMIERYLEVKAAAVVQPSNVVALPPRSEPHVTPEIAAALAAATGERIDAPTTPVLIAPAAQATVLPMPARPTMAGGRPSFRSDQDMAAWLIANPGAITDRDRALMAERLRSWTFRELLPAAGVDPAALADLIKSKTNYGG